MSWWQPVLQVGGALLGGILEGEAGDKSSQKMVDATNRAADLQKLIYQDQTARSEPFRQNAFDATNMIRNIYGQSQLTDTVAPGGEIGARNGAPDYASYVRNSPDLAAEFAKPGVSGMFGGDIGKYGEWHSSTFGDREVPVYGGAKPTASGTSPASTGNAFSDPYQAFLDSSFNKAATEVSTRDLDQIRSSFGTAGKAVSGSHIGAASDRLASNRYNAFGDYFSGLTQQAGQGPAITSNMNTNAGQYGVNTGNMMLNQGKIAADASGQKYNAWLDAGKKAVGGIYDYGNNNGWFE